MIDGIPFAAFVDISGESSTLKPMLAPSHLKVADFLASPYPHSLSTFIESAHKLMLMGTSSIHRGFNGSIPLKINGTSEWRLSWPNHRTKWGRFFADFSMDQLNGGYTGGF